MTRRKLRTRLRIFVHLYSIENNNFDLERISISSSAHNARINLKDIVNVLDGNVAGGIRNCNWKTMIKKNSRKFLLLDGMELRVEKELPMFPIGSEIKLAIELDNKWVVYSLEQQTMSMVVPKSAILSNSLIWKSCKPIRLGMLACCNKCGFPLQMYEEENHYDSCK